VFSSPYPRPWTRVGKSWEEEIESVGPGWVSWTFEMVYEGQGMIESANIENPNIPFPPKRFLQTFLCLCPYFEIA